MKSPTLLATALLALTSSAAVIEPALKFRDDLKYERVNFEEPLNWGPGPRLFPAMVVAGFNAPEPEYDAGSWAKYVLNKCKQFGGACTSTISFKAINSGSDGGKFWFGYVFRGGPTIEWDYIRQDTVSDSIAYTIVFDDEDKVADQAVLELKL
ncbi:hypothetical protein GE09DRAFT_1210928 [Coniochaeta sp. 2T2.1]|nr:hypothetical protein GE09DRAFT_1210928 [Coniochaeta sp. 2T2.1]